MKSQYILFDNGKLEIAFWPRPCNWLLDFSRQRRFFGGWMWNLALGPLDILWLGKA